MSNVRVHKYLQHILQVASGKSDIWLGRRPLETSIHGLYSADDPLRRPAREFQVY